MAKRTRYEIDRHSSMGKPFEGDVPALMTAAFRALDDYPPTQQWDEHRLVFHADQVWRAGTLDWTNVRVSLVSDNPAAAKAVAQALHAVDPLFWSYAKDPDFMPKHGMFSAEGDELVGMMLEQLEIALRNGELSPVRLEIVVEENRQAIASAGFGEVYDTAVRECVWARLDRVLEELGILRLDV
jgi:hypothetical protein